MYEDEEEELEEETFIAPSGESGFSSLIQVDELEVAKGLSGISVNAIVDIMDNNLRLLQIYRDSNPIVASHLEDIHDGMLALILQLKQDLPQVCVEILSGMSPQEQLIVIEQIDERLEARRQSIVNSIEEYI